MNSPYTPSAVTTSAYPAPPSLLQRLLGRPLVLFLDVDGTLAPIAQRPGAAAVPPETRHVVRELARLPDVYVAVVSGRAASDAAEKVALDDVYVIGNHGFELAMPGASPEPQSGAAMFVDRIATAAVRINAFLGEFPGAFVEDKRWTLSVHYRAADPAHAPELETRVTEIAVDEGLRTTRGKMVIEVRPPIAVTKGTAVLALANRLGAFEPGASVFVAGDDQTDEDAFVAMRSVDADFVTVRVAGSDDPESVETAAEFSVPDTVALRELLEALLGERGGRAIEPRG